MCGLLLRPCHRQNNWRHMSALCSMGQAAHWLRQPSSASNVWIGDTGKQDLWWYALLLAAQGRLSLFLR